MCLGTQLSRQALCKTERLPIQELWLRCTESSARKTERAHCILFHVGMVRKQGIIMLNHTTEKQWRTHMPNGRLRILQILQSGALIKYICRLTNLYLQRMRYTNSPILRDESRTSSM